MEAAPRRGGHYAETSPVEMGTGMPSSSLKTVGQKASVNGVDVTLVSLDPPKIRIGKDEREVTQNQWLKEVGAQVDLLPHAPEGAKATPPATELLLREPRMSRFGKTG
jgi:hypothetical protein